MTDQQQAAIEAAAEAMANDGVMVGDASYEFDRWLAAHDREVTGAQATSSLRS